MDTTVAERGSPSWCEAIERRVQALTDEVQHQRDRIRHLEDRLDGEGVPTAVKLLRDIFDYIRTERRRHGGP